MRLYINARFLTQHVTGVQRNAVELVKALDNLIDKEGDSGNRHSLTLLSPREVRYEPDLKNIPLRKVGRLQGHAWEQLELPFFARDGLLANLCNTGPLVTSRQIITIHDAAVFVFPQSYSLAFGSWYRFLHKRIRAVKVVTDSQFAKSEITRCCHVKDGRTHVVYLGADHMLDVQADESVISRHGLIKPFILAAGSMAANKNFRAVAGAAQLLGNEDFDFVVVGGANPKVFAGSGILPPQGVKYLGYVNDNELKALYSHASCFIYPSLYEGFGLPPLEAMACGCPVVVSNAASLPEVCGDAAVYCDPRSTEDLASKILTVMRDSDLQNSLRRRGPERAALFTWEKTARQTLKLYQEALNLL